MNGAPLGALAAQAARRFAGRPCLVHGARRWNFADVEAIVGALARTLRHRLSPGARVGLFMSNRPEFVFLQLALERAGMVRVPVNARATAHEVGIILEDCSTSAVFFDATTCEVAAAVAVRPSLAPIWFCQVDADVASNGSRWAQLVPAPDAPHDAHIVDADDVCSINYTSGTSGKPKGVVLTHRNWAAMYRNMLVDRDMRPDDVFVHVGPLTHSSGAYFLAWFLRGACNVLVDGAGVDAMLQTMARERATVFTCVPTVLTRIVNHPDIDRFDLGSIRAIGYGAEPIPFNTLEKTIARFGPIVTQNYGLTEAMMTVTLLRPDEHFTEARALRVGCIGRPYSFVEVVLRAPDGTEVGPGEVGEITIRSEHMMERYWERPAETAKVLREGWLWSGDLATRDADGYITLAGRSKEMLISGGFNIYPAEVEALLTSHPSVLEAAVIGAPDATWGEIAIAYVSAVPGSALDGETLRAHCKPILGLRTPKVFHVVDQLPKNANGKIDKPALKAAQARVQEEAGRG